MFGLSVRWSLTNAPAETLAHLRKYVEEESFAAYAGLDGLRFKTWGAREGEWFEGHYVFVSADAREKFQASFEETVAVLPARASSAACRCTSSRSRSWP